MNNPGSATTAAMPNQVLPGNKTPAEVNGDAHPTMQRGGTAERTRAAVTAHGLRVGLGVQKTTHGNDNTVAAANHRPIASTLFAGQYTSDTPITGSDAEP
jgi:hypothetical protein